MLYASPSRIQDYTCQVVFNRECGHELKLLRLKVQSEATPFICQPGQFVMLDLPESGFYFRRPFSVLDTPTPDSLDIYYKRVGKGTALMWQLETGNSLKCLAPLGIGFTSPIQPETALYIGGGIGIAPLYMLAKKVSKVGHGFYGIRRRAEIGLETELQDIFGKQLHIATDDGSYGFHGNVCQLLSQHESLVLAAKEAYICGPMRMMQATAELLSQLNPSLQVQVSLEEHMPCGTGACTGCVIPRSDQYLPSKVCTEGPVFNANAIHWTGGLLPLNHFCEESPCPL
jgi:dihydroorotate dehydrogenase electron transfer subunit